MTYAELMAHAEDIRHSAVEATMATVDDHPQWRPAVEREFADVPAAFRPLAGLPDPEGFAAPLEDLAGVLCGLSMGDDRIPANPELARIAGTNAALCAWSGAAATAFRTGFMEPLPAKVRNQFIVALVLRAALEAQRDLWARARDDADQIAEKTLAAIDAVGDCTRAEWTVTFTVVASVAALLAVPLTGGLALAAVAVGAAAQIAAATGPSEPVRTAFSAADAAGVVERARDAIGLLRGHIHDGQARIAAALRVTHELVAGRPELF